VHIHHRKDNDEYKEVVNIISRVTNQHETYYYVKVTQRLR